MISVDYQTSYSPVASHARMAEPDSTQETTENKPKNGEAELSDADQKKLRELKARDREVRAHEQAHLSAAGSYAKGGATYTYERGPDQRMYAIGGQVQVDTSKVANDPVATLRKAQVIRQAALAPINPSSQDRRVAAQATQMENEARAELAAEKVDSGSSATSTDSTGIVKVDDANTPATCPSCGGAHSSGAHDGMTAYGAVQTA
ncbi:MAG: putative metalloprotease CJM1_0395 family protein [Gammaproteobacteria bacterium]